MLTGCVKGFLRVISVLLYKVHCLFHLRVRLGELREHRLRVVSASEQTHQVFDLLKLRVCRRQLLKYRRITHS